MSDDPTRDALAVAIRCDTTNEAIVDRVLARFLVIDRSDRAAVVEQMAKAAYSKRAGAAIPAGTAWPYIDGDTRDRYRDLASPMLAALGWPEEPS